MKRNANFTFLLLLVFQAAGYAQLRSFSTNHVHKTTLAMEKIELSVTELPEKQAAGTIVLGAASALVTPAMKIGKTYLDKKAASYAASYSGSLTNKELAFRESTFTPFQLEIVRKTYEKENTTPTTDSKIVLHAVKSANDPLFRFKLQSLQLNASKARIKRKNRKNKGRTIDLNIEVQVSVYYRDELKLADTSDKASTKLSYTLKTLALGSSSITVQGVKPDGAANDYSKQDDNVLFSDWFQILPDPVLSKEVKAIVEGNRSALDFWTTIKVTVKEANPFGVNATKLAEYFGSSEEGFADFLKALIPAGADKEE